VNNILQLIGSDLATIIRDERLPTVELDIAKPHIFANGCYIRFIDFLIPWLHRPMNSVFIVADNVEFAKDYVNSLALLMDDQARFINFIYSRQYDLEDDVNKSRAERIVQKLIGKKLFKFRTKTFLELNELSGNWDLFNQIAQEANELKCFLVPDFFSSLVTSQGPTKYTKLDLDVFFATRGTARISFIVPISWQDYTWNIEHGKMAGIIRHFQPFLLDPRPKSLPEIPHHLLALSPDHLFEF